MNLFESPEWNTFMILFFYNISDFTGRILTKVRKSPEPWSRPFLITCSILRLIFVAPSFIIALNDTVYFWNMPVVILFNTFAIAISGGFLGVAACSGLIMRLENDEKEFGG